VQIFEGQPLLVLPHQAHCADAPAAVRRDHGPRRSREARARGVFKPGPARPAAPTPLRALAGAVGLPPVRILLAEDNPINQKVELLQLANLGYGADTAANGLEVLDALDQVSYDIILMDCQMPLMDGYETTREIRRRESGRRRSIIIAVTADAMPEQRKHCMECGMDDYLSKPIQVRRLGEVLAEWSARVASERPPVPSPDFETSQLSAS
jgi:CheY-like chemotaxis protein